MRKALLVLIPVAIVAAIVTLFLMQARTPDASEQIGPEPGDVVVRLTDELRFVPDYLEIDPGQTVVWINESEKVHTVSTEGRAGVNPDHTRLPEGAEAWNSSNIAPGGSFKRTFDTPGLYRYYCAPHAEMAMVGEILVRGGPEEAPEGDQAEEWGPP